ncbi:GIY-YIG nuclease family protein [candidate division Kazan bacterium]|uniref:GIY-YIG nuclease family protein n=1 Tax=candidate division Kazan bacterium TaxID=2202143 RepID=A0A420ZD21_UNCK3|nr:MAG: GIY-YIG nuclease family protein [candidate division Kazan bacterium]
MYYVYILRSKVDENFYVGFSENLKQRILDHNSGKNLSTRIRKPFDLIFYESFVDKFDALRRERYLKSNKGRTMIKQLLREYLSKS